ncbi:DUF305 domain-containing protein [Sphaerisporangium sp. NPDC005289]|uniref:DUF305 domain-containing protein n=1 Tax=Sphaerisporangium sp. NPDC005289 TaxID=3155247 RepID=UPI0033BB82B0
MGARGVAAAGVAAVLGLVTMVSAGGCAAAPDGGAVKVAASYDDLPYNLTDVLFRREMILHYRQGVTLARLVPGRGRDPYVRGLAERLTGEEAAQVEELAVSLRMWQFTVPDSDKPPVHQMEGMLTPARLLALKGRSGPAFDRLWLTTLARHTDYGARLADKARDEGKDAATVALARRTAVTQKTRLTEIVSHLS